MHNDKVGAAPEGKHTAVPAAQIKLHENGKKLSAA